MTTTNHFDHERRAGASRSRHKESTAVGVPFYGVVAPVGYVGEAIYAAFDAIGRAFAATFEKARRTARIRATENALNQLDDRILADIGIRRGDIGFVATYVTDHPGRDPRKVR